MKRIFLVRHGEIPSNKINRYSGWSEEELNETGVRQAREVAQRLDHYHIGHVFTSPIKRAVQTAHIIGDALGIEPVVEPGLKELRLGSWEGLSTEDIAGRYPHEWHIWNTDPSRLRLPGRETLEELLDRAVWAIKNIKKETNGNSGTVAITHVAIIRVLQLWVQKRSLDLYKKIEIPNGAILDLFSGNFI